MSDERTQTTAQLDEEPVAADVDVDEVIDAEATEDTGDLDEPQAGEVEELEGDTVEEGAE